MISILVAVRDSAAKAFNRPFCVPFVGVAIRSFAQEVNRGGDPNNVMNTNPSDFELYEIGSFDEESGKLYPLDEPRSVARAVDHKQSE